MAKAAASAPTDKVALYEKLVAAFPGVERKGATLPYTSLHGNMFSLLTPSGMLALRLSAEERDAFTAKYKTAPVVMYGTHMKEYVGVPDSLLRRTSELRKYFGMSVAYAGSLKPKPTTKPKKGKQ